MDELRYEKKFQKEMEELKMHENILKHRSSITGGYRKPYETI